MSKKRKLITETGQEYSGYGFGSDASRVCELVFNTSMAGYQEIVSDPSYTYQAIVMSYPLIGNYGMAEDDYESEFLSAGALIVHEYNDIPSNFRSINTLSEVMEKYERRWASQIAPSGHSSEHVLDAEERKAFDEYMENINCTYCITE